MQYLAEFGVVFLMFVIGLEFNLPKLKSMRKLVFGLGLAQVMLTIIGSVAGHYLLMLGLLVHRPALGAVVAGRHRARRARWRCPARPSSSS